MLLFLLFSCAVECVDELGTHASGTTWTCPDGCNTCSCDNGALAHTDMACVGTCVDETGTSYAYGDTWTCADGCNTCECLEDGTISATEMACD